MTALADILRRQIAAQGPITVADYMAQCLLHPRHGYYMTRDPLGQAGDFTTAPEISQMFGELLGLLLAQVWMDQGAPAPFTLAELGPGRGTLMADILRATARVPGFHDGARLHLVEASPVLRAAQAERVPGATWHDSADDLPEGQPLFIIANEFFDALPIRQFLRHPKGWAERVVGLEGDTLTFGLTPPAPLAALDDRLDGTADGTMVETCAPALPVIDALSSRIMSLGGFALIVDYGDWGSAGDTVQAIRQQQKDPVLAHPGEADLTAHVDFHALAKASPLAATPLTPQGVLLARLGIAQRAEALARNLTGAARDSHMAAYRRLTDAGEMGQLFKVLGLYPPGAPQPPGFG
ncbi:MAG: class I SAM-dependent methyltransferase [Alphaproteobacteria bacterium]|jgi:SAM-dependent MidA family methyltransferase|nr:class I SAM-dependent methyltransferase [Alphaproteobacteria bacterium]